MDRHFQKLSVCVLTYMCIACFRRLCLNTSDTIIHVSLFLNDIFPFNCLKEFDGDFVCCIPLCYKYDDHISKIRNTENRNIDGSIVGKNHKTQLCILMKLNNKLKKLHSENLQGEERQRCKGINKI